MFSGKILKKLKLLRRRPVPKDAVKRGRDELLALMEEYPLRQPKRQQFGWMPAVTWKPVLAIFLILAVISGSSGAVYAAQGSLPGEALYPVKLASEEVRERLMFSPEARFRFKAERAGRRLAEAEKLLGKPHFRPEDRNLKIKEVMGRYEKQVVKMDGLMGKLDDGERERLRVRFRAIGQVVGQHGQLIESATSVRNGLEALIVSPVKASLDLESKCLGRLQEKRGWLEALGPEQHEAIEERARRLRKHYERFRPARPGPKISPVE